MEGNNENIGEIVLRKARADGLIMSRVPKQARDIFLKLAEDSFADDYGMTLAFLIDEFTRNILLTNIDIKLNYLISLIENQNKGSTEEVVKQKKIKMLGGNEKKIEKEVNQK